MNIGQIKLIAWTVAAVLTLGLAYYVLHFVHHFEEKGRSPNPKDAQRILEGVQDPVVKSDDILTYDEAKRLIAQLDWTGAPKAVAAPVAPVEVKKEPTAIPVSRLVTVRALQQEL